MQRISVRSIGTKLNRKTIPQNSSSVIERSVSYLEPEGFEGRTRVTTEDERVA